MRFDKFLPSPQLQHYVKYFVVSENDLINEYNVFPSTGIVIGFQYSGELSTIKNDKEDKLSAAGVTGISAGYKTFRNTAGIGTILVYFTAVGFAHFASHPAHELFNLSVSLENVFNKNRVSETEDRLRGARTDKQRIHIVERFLLSQLKDIQTDKLIVEAVKIIYQTKGTIRIRELNERLFISQSPFEKRFRKLVGTTAKKFASIVRFNAVLDDLGSTKTLMDICHDNNFFDQAHFIKDFKQYTGDAPENFKRFL